MRPKLTKIVAISIITATALAAVAVVAVSIYLNSDAFRTRLIDEVNARIDGRIFLKKHRLSLFSGELALYGLGLVESDDKPVATLETLRLNISLPDLVWKTVHITGFTVDQGNVTLLFNDQQQLNLMQAVALTNPSSGPSVPQKEKSGASAWNVRLDELQVGELNFRFEQPSKHLFISGERIGLTGHGNLSQRQGHLALSMDRLALKTKDLDQSLHKTTLVADYQGKSAQPITLDIKTPSSRLETRGDLNWQPSPVSLSLKTVFSIDLKEVQPWLPQDLQLSGQVAGDLSIQGPPGNPEATLNLSASQGGVMTVPFDHIGINAELARHQLTIAHGEIKAPWGDIGLAGNMDLSPLFALIDGQDTDTRARAPFDLTINGENISTGLLPYDGLPGGRWQGRIQVSGDNWANPLAGGKAEVDGQVASFQMAPSTTTADGTVSVRADWDDAYFKVQQLTAGLADATVRANGQYHWDSGVISLHSQLTAKQLETIGAVFDVPLPSGIVQLTADATGPWRRPTAHLTLTSDQTGMAGWHFGRLWAKAEFASDGKLTLTRIDIENGVGRAKGTARLNLFDQHGHFTSQAPLELSLNLKELTLSDFYPDLPVDVALNGILKAKGTLLDPDADLALSKSLIDWQDRKFEADGNANWKNGLLSIHNLHVQTEASAVDVKGTARWRDPDGQWRSDPDINGDLKSSGLNLADFLPKSKGILTIGASVSGRTSSLAGRFDVNGGADLVFYGQNLAGIDINGRLADNTVFVNHLQLSLAPEQDITGTGWFAFDQRFQAQLKGAALDLRAIDSLQKGYPTAGRMDLNFQAHGTVADPQMQGTVLVRGPEINERQFDDFTLQIQLTQRRLALDALLDFRLTAHYDLDGGGFDINAFFDQTDLRPYLAMGLGEQWKGKLHGRIEAQGNRFDLDSIRADVSLSDTELIFEKIKVLELPALNASLNRGVLNLAPTRLRLLQEGYLDLSARGNVGTSTELTADGRLPLAILEPFTEHVDQASGDILFNLKGAGPLAQMRWQGDLTFADVGISLIDLGQRIHDLNGQVTVTPKLFDVAELTGKLDDGRFKLQGRIEMDDFRPDQFNLQLNAFSLPLRWPDTVDATVMVNVNLQGDLERSVLSGNLMLLDGLYYKNLRYNLLAAVTQPQRTRQIKPITTPPKWMQTIRLNLDLTHRYPFLVDNNVAQLSIAPELKVTGTLASPLLSGRTQVTEGEVYFRGKTFEVEKGVVDFVNPFKTEPLFDIQAQAQIREWLITLSVEGTPDTLVVKLSSIPTLSDSNILSLIILGRTSEELSEEGSGAATTGQMLARLVESAWGEDIKKSTGVDILEVETGGTEDDQSADRIQLTVGKQVTRRLTVKYALETGSEQFVHRAISEYRLLEHILASGFSDSKGKYGGELVFRIEMR